MLSRTATCLLAALGLACSAMAAEVSVLAPNAAKEDGKLAAATRTDFARSGIGVAVPESVVQVDVSTSDAVKAALLSARTIVVSSGTSGRHMVEVFAKLGVGDQLKAKTTQPPSGAQIADVLATGEADLGFQQISELLHAKGIRYLGPVPAQAVIRASGIEPL